MVPFTNYLSLYTFPRVLSVPLPCFSSMKYSPSYTDPSFQVNLPQPCLQPFWISPSQMLPLGQIMRANYNAPELKTAFSQWISDSAQQNTLPFRSSQCSTAQALQLFLKQESVKRELQSFQSLIPFPWYLLCLSVPLYSLPLMQLITPKTRRPLKIPISVDSGVYLTPCPFLLPAQNSPSYTSCLKISLPWKCLSPNRNCPMYLEVLEMSTPLPCSMLFFHSPMYLMP